MFSLLLKDLNFLLLFIIDTVEFKVFLTEDKVNKIILRAENLLKKGTVVVRELSSFIGKMPFMLSLKQLYIIEEWEEINSKG